MESSLPHMGKLSQPHHLSPCWVSGCKEGLCWAASFSSIKKKLCHPLQFLHSVTASPSNNSRNLLVVLLMGKISPDQQNKEKKIKNVISGRIQIIKCNITRRLALSRHAAGPWKKIFVENLPYSGSGHKAAGVFVGSFFSCLLFTVSSLLSHLHFKGAQTKPRAEL